MKIALVSQEYPPETAKGGIGTQTFIKAKGLSALGHEVHVISRSIDDARHELEDGAIHITRIPGFESHMPEMTDIVQWMSYSLLVAAELEMLHSRVCLDLVDFPEWAAEGYAYLLNRMPWKNVPAVIQLHGPLVLFGQVMSWPDRDSPFYKTGTFMEAACVQLADAVYSSSACSTKWIRDWYEPGKEDIPTIHLGIDTKAFAPRQAPRHDRPTIVFVGKIVRNKGVEELVEAAAVLAKDIPGLRLRLIGAGEPGLIGHLKEMALRHEASGLLDFAGFRSKDALPDELSRAHVFAAPSHYEGGPGFVYLEAMACGLPVIGCSGSGVDEIVASGQTGILVPPGDVKALEAALRKVLLDEPLRRQMGVNAREYVLRHADSMDCVRRLEAFYISVVQRAAKSREVLIHE
jgi:glycosyltransferase involved in cell wall biosynthesis